MHRRSKVLAWAMTASGPRAATSWEARATRTSPVRMAAELPHTVWALGAPRRSGASSMTSSW